MPDVDCFFRMASRKAQKEAARERRLAEERARHERAARTRRLRMVGGVIVGAIVLVAVAIAVSSGGSSSAKVVTPSSPAAKKAQTSVNSLLQGIPQNGNTLGSPSAKVTVTEYGDLVCPVCKSFALGAENQLIANEVRSGKVKLVYRALETASQTANNSMFVPSQTAALAAGQQKLGWNYIELFYHEQGDETTSYVSNNFLGGLAKQISGLNFSQWSSDSQSSSLTSQVTKDTQSAAAQGYSATPTIVVTGPKSQAKPIVSLATYSQLQSAIKSVSAG
jgi:protein-disulfide isomerase